MLVKQQLAPTVKRLMASFHATALAMIQPFLSQLAVMQTSAVPLESS